jgi:hypothetical protein
MNSSRSPIWPLLWIAVAAPLVVGCQGCRQDSAGTDQPAPGEIVVAKDLGSLPGETQADRMLVKPGHWMTISETWQANGEDLRGQLSASPTGQRQQAGQGQLSPLARNSAASLKSIRPAVLPKGQSKRLECRILIPAGSSDTKQSVDVRTRFDAANQPVVQSGSVRLAATMQPHEYFFAVLSDRPQQFAALQISDWVRAPQNEFEAEPATDYRVVFPAGDGLLPLPDTIFEWSSTAYLLWDDIAPEQLTKDQRNAIRDWIYWGGQLIINGPAAAESFFDSDLSDLLPLDSVRGSGLDAEPLVEMVTWASIPTDRSTGTVVALLRDESKRIGVMGQTVAGAEEVPGTSGLVIQRPMGRGRVVMTRFDVTASWLLKWDSMQSFYNGVLLRRPPRKYQEINGEAVLVTSDGSRNQLHDARLNSRFRIFSRDAWIGVDERVDNGSDAPPGPRTEPANDQGQESPIADAGGATVAETTVAESTVAESTVPGATVPEATVTGNEVQEADIQVAESGASDPQPDTGDASETAQLSVTNRWLAPGEAFKPGQGVGTWTDSSDSAKIAMNLLREEAGIEIPGVAFVAKSLAIYLFVLVPLNYLIFWSVGRLEWAWLMVPVIGLVGAVWIARAARLDIGFARSRTEINLLELHAGYQRGHATRYIGLYNSLSTTYALSFENRDAVAAPFGIFSGSETIPACEFRQSFDESVSLAGLLVPSNQTSSVHAEQMIDIDGVFASTAGETVWREPWRISNRSRLTLYDAVVVGRQPDGSLVHDNLGIVDSIDEVTVRLKPGPGSVAEGLPLGVDRMIRILCRGDALGMGQIMLIGRVEEPLGSLTVQPEVSQVTTQTVVVLHLVSPAIPAVELDENLRTDVRLFEDGKGTEDLEEINSQPDA